MRALYTLCFFFLQMAQSVCSKRSGCILHHALFFFSSSSKHDAECTGGCKDLGLMQRLAKESNVPLPLADIIMSHEREAEQQGNGDKDWGCIADVIRDKAGLGKR